jgi:hypothetical protein
MASPMALIMSFYLLYCALDIWTQGVSAKRYRADFDPHLSPSGTSLKSGEKAAISVSPVVCLIFTAAASNGRCVRAAIHHLSDQLLEPFGQKIGIFNRQCIRFLLRFPPDDIVDKFGIASIRDAVWTFRSFFKGLGYSRLTAGPAADVSDAGNDVRRNPFNEVLTSVFGRYVNGVGRWFANGQAVGNRRPALAQLVGKNFQDIVHLIICYVHVASPLLAVV